MGEGGFRLPRCLCGWGRYAGAKRKGGGVMRFRGQRQSRTIADRRGRGGGAAGGSGQAPNAVRKIGDEVVQQPTGGRTQPHRVRPGTSGQDTRGFATGCKAGQMFACAPFATERP